MTRAILLGSILGIITVPVLAVDPAPPLTPPPAANVPTSSVAAPAMDQTIARIPLRTLSVVQDVRETRTPWQQAADEAAGRVIEPSLKSNVTQQLARVAPQIAKTLLTQPGQNAMVTVAVYKERGTDKQMLAAVAFEGLGDALNPSFFPRVLASLPEVPGAKQEQTQKLELDSQATSYLCFFIDHGELKAGDITDARMKQSLGAAIDHARADAAQGPVVPSGIAANSPPTFDPTSVTPQPPAATPASTVQPNTAAPANTAQPNLDDGSTSPYWNSPAYGSNPYYGSDGWIPWVSYLPGDGGVPVVVQPDFRHPHREQADVRRSERAADVPQTPANQSPNRPLDNSVNPGESGRAVPGAAPAARPVTPEPPRETPARSEPAPAHSEPIPAHAELAPAEAHGAPTPAPAPAKK